MAIFYSANNNGFYHTNVQKSLFSEAGEPIGIIADAVKITLELHEDLLAGNAAGKEIAPDPRGHPVLVTPRITDEVKWERIRVDRTELLAASDYTQMPDYPADNKPLWGEYRQELRDITASFSDPDNVVWPTPPA